MNIEDLNWRTQLGWGLTAIWIVIFLVIAGFQWDTLKGMTPGAWGDFLGGVSAPVALLWLIVGYFQQGEELNLQFQEMKEQKLEMKAQAEATRILADTALASAEENKRILALQTRTVFEILPRCERASELLKTDETNTLTIEPIGGEAHQLKIHSTNCSAYQFNEDFGKKRFTLTEPWNTYASPIHIRLTYLNSMTQRRYVDVRWKRDKTVSVSNEYGEE